MGLGRQIEKRRNTCKALRIFDGVSFYPREDVREDKLSLSPGDDGA